MPWAEVLDRLVGSYKDLNPNTPSSYILVSADRQRALPKLLEVCAASLRCVEDRSQYDQMILAVPKKDEQSLAYIEWLINHPFKRFKDIIHLLKHNDEYYIHILDLTKFPANALFNFTIATRAPIEFEPTMNMWSKLIGLGLTPGLANLIAGLVVVKPESYNYREPALDGKLTMVGPMHSGHWWLFNHSNWDQVLAGEMTGLTKPYTESGNCVPAAAIWGEQEQTYDMFENYTLQQLAEKFPNEA